MASGKKYKKFSVTGVTNQNSDINVTPLIDVVLVLLIIFMVVTPLLEKDIEVKVPETEQEDQPQDVPPDQLVVSLSADGQIAINLEKVTDEEYALRLSRMLKAKSEDDRLVFFMPDEKVNYGRLIAALDGARQAGAKILGMMTELPEGGLPQAPGAPGAPGTPTPPAPPTTP
jgi:biopolymer transport protein TolR